MYRDNKPTPIHKFRNRGFEAQLVNREHGFSSNSGKQYLAIAVTAIDRHPVDARRA